MKTAVCIGLALNFVLLSIEVYRRGSIEGMTVLMGNCFVPYVAAIMILIKWYKNWWPT